MSDYSKHKIIGAIACVMMLAISGCTSVFKLSSDDLGLDKVAFHNLRQQNPQAKIGELEHPKIVEEYGGVYESEKINKMLISVLARIITDTQVEDHLFSITVLDSPSINAFALPGGYLYITRGLIALANSESEIAAVLAHEIAHVAKNHGVERTKQARNVSIVERVVDEVVSNELAGKVARASAKQKLAVFSKTQELQADREGIRILHKAGFNPYAAANLLESMERFSQWKSKFGNVAVEIENFHPSTPQRIKLAKKYAKEYNPNAKNIEKEEKEKFLDAVDGMIFGDNEIEGAIRKNRFSHIGFNITFEVPEPFIMFNRADAIVAIGKNEEALRFDAVPIPDDSHSPQQYIQSGWVKGLIKDSVVREEINFFDAATANSKTGKWQFAIAVMEVGQRYFRFVLAAPNKNKNINEKFKTIIQSFRAMSEFERENLQTLKIKIVEIQPKDSFSDIIKPMNSMHQSQQLFKAINGLNDKQAPKTGDKVKIISP